MLRLTEALLETTCTTWKTEEMKSYLRATRERQSAATRERRVPALRPGAGPAPSMALALQRTIGNVASFQLIARQRAAGATVARQDKPKAPPADVAADADVLQWPSILMPAVREAGKHLEVTLHEPSSGQAPTLNEEEKTGGGTLDAKATAIIAAIKKNRAVDTSFLKLTKYKPKGSKTEQLGYTWADASKDTTAPKALEGIVSAEGAQTLEGKRKIAQQWVWEEFAHEGGSLSINAYDEMRMTWGRGMAGAHLEGFFSKVIADPEAKKAFLRFGITFDGTWKVVNVANGAIETGTEALQLMQAHPEILAAFRYAAESNRQAVADAQWGEMAAKGAGKVPDGVLDPLWPKASIQIMAHIHHAGDARGYGMLDYYKGLGAPDPGALWTGFMRLLAGNPDPNGCYVVSSQLHHVTEMRQWGGGAIIPALAGVLRGPIKTTRQQVGSAPELKGQVAMILPGGDTYLVWPAESGVAALTDEQEKALGGSDRRALLRRLNGYPIKDMLEEMKARKTDVQGWLKGGPEIRAMSAGETNEERLWWAMNVVATGKVPPRPRGKDSNGDDLVPKGQVIEAYQWLGKTPPAEDKIP
jgi:hypothetical protein